MYEKRTQLLNTLNWVLQNMTPEYMSMVLLGLNASALPIPVTAYSAVLQKLTGESPLLWNKNCLLDDQA